MNSSPRLSSGQSSSGNSSHHSSMWHLGGPLLGGSSVARKAPWKVNNGNSRRVEWAESGDLSLLEGVFLVNGHSSRNMSAGASAGGGQTAPPCMPGFVGYQSHPQSFQGSASSITAGPACPPIAGHPMGSSGNMRLMDLVRSQALIPRTVLSRGSAAGGGLAGMNPDQLPPRPEASSKMISQRNSHGSLGYLANEIAFG
jgi:hypothetical protein